MKHRGNGNPYKEQRDQEILAAYRKACASTEHIRLIPDLLIRVANSPCSRFFVSETRAMDVIKRIEKGDELSDMLPMRRRMFLKIYEIYREMRENEPDTPFDELVLMATAHPADEFYLEPMSVSVILNRIRQERRKKKK